MRYFQPHLLSAMKLNVLGRPRHLLWILPLLVVLGVAAWYFSRQGDGAPNLPPRKA